MTGRSGKGGQARKRGGQFAKRGGWIRKRGGEFPKRGGQVVGDVEECAEDDGFVAFCGGDVLRLFPFRALLYKARENGKRGKSNFPREFSQREIWANCLKAP